MSAGSEFGNLTLKRWLKKVGQVRRGVILKKLKKDLQNSGLNRWIVRCSLLQLASASHVLLDRLEIKGTSGGFRKLRQEPVSVAAPRRMSAHDKDVYTAVGEDCAGQLRTFSLNTARDFQTSFEDNKVRAKENRPQKIECEAKGEVRILENAGVNGNEELPNRTPNNDSDCNPKLKTQTDHQDSETSKNTLTSNIPDNCEKKKATSKELKNKDPDNTLLLDTTQQDSGQSKRICSAEINNNNCKKLTDSILHDAQLSMKSPAVSFKNKAETDKHQRRRKSSVDNRHDVDEKSASHVRAETTDKDNAEEQHDEFKSLAQDRTAEMFAKNERRIDADLPTINSDVATSVKKHGNNAIRVKKKRRSETGEDPVHTSTKGCILDVADGVRTVELTTESDRQNHRVETAADNIHSRVIHKRKSAELESTERIEHSSAGRRSSDGSKITGVPIGRLVLGATNLSKGSVAIVSGKQDQEPRKNFKLDRHRSNLETAREVVGDFEAERKNEIAEHLFGERRSSEGSRSTAIPARTSIDGVVLGATNLAKESQTVIREHKQVPKTNLKLVHQENSMETAKDMQRQNVTVARDSHSHRKHERTEHRKSISDRSKTASTPIVPSVDRVIIGVKTNLKSVNKGNIVDSAEEMQSSVMGDCNSSRKNEGNGTNGRRTSDGSGTSNAPELASADESVFGATNFAKEGVTEKDTSPKTNAQLVSTGNVATPDITQHSVPELLGENDNSLSRSPMSRSAIRYPIKLNIKSVVKDQKETVKEIQCENVLITGDSDLRRKNEKTEHPSKNERRSSDASKTLVTALQPAVDISSGITNSTKQSVAVASEEQNKETEASFKLVPHENIRRSVAPEITQCSVSELSAKDERIVLEINGCGVKNVLGGHLQNEEVEAADQENVLTTGDCDSHQKNERIKTIIANRRISDGNRTTAAMNESVVIVNGENDQGPKTNWKVINRAPQMRQLSMPELSTDYDESLAAKTKKFTATSEVKEREQRSSEKTVITAENKAVSNEPKIVLASDSSQAKKIKGGHLAEGKVEAAKEKKLEKVSVVEECDVRRKKERIAHTAGRRISEGIRTSSNGRIFDGSKATLVVNGVERVVLRRTNSVPDATVMKKRHDQRPKTSLNSVNNENLATPQITQHPVPELPAEKGGIPARKSMKFSHKSTAKNRNEQRFDIADVAAENKSACQAKNVAEGDVPVGSVHNAILRQKSTSSIKVSLNLFHNDEPIKTAAFPHSPIYSNQSKAPFVPRNVTEIRKADSSVPENDLRQPQQKITLREKIVSKGREDPRRRTMSREKSCSEETTVVFGCEVNGVQHASGIEKVGLDSVYSAETQVHPVTESVCTSVQVHNEKLVSLEAFTNGEQDLNKSPNGKEHGEALNKICAAQQQQHLHKDRRPSVGDNPNDIRWCLRGIDKNQRRLSEKEPDKTREQAAGKRIKRKESRKKLDQKYAEIFGESEEVVERDVPPICLYSPHDPEVKSFRVEFNDKSRPPNLSKTHETKDSYRLGKRRYSSLHGSISEKNDVDEIISAPSQKEPRIETKQADKTDFPHKENHSSSIKESKIQRMRGSGSGEDREEKTKSSAIKSDVLLNEAKLRIPKDQTCSKIGAENKKDENTCVLPDSSSGISEDGQSWEFSQQDINVPNSPILVNKANKTSKKKRKIKDGKKREALAAATDSNTNTETPNVVNSSINMAEVPESSTDETQRTKNVTSDLAKFFTSFLDTSSAENSNPIPDSSMEGLEFNAQPMESIESPSPNVTSSNVDTKLADFENVGEKHPTHNSQQSTIVPQFTVKNMAAKDSSSSETNVTTTSPCVAANRQNSMRDQEFLDIEESTQLYEPIVDKTAQGVQKTVEVSPDESKDALQDTFKQSNFFQTISTQTVVPPLEASVTKKVGVDHSSGTCVENRNTDILHIVTQFAHELPQDVSPVAKSTMLLPKPTPQITKSLDQTGDRKVLLEIVPKQISSLVPEDGAQNQLALLERKIVVSPSAPVTKEVGVDHNSGTCITNRNTRIQYNVSTLASSDRKTGLTSGSSATQFAHDFAQNISPATMLPPKPTPRITTSLDQTVDTKVFLETVPKQISSLVPENCAQNQSPFLEQNTVVPTSSSVTKEVDVDHESGACITNRNTRLQYNVLTLASSDRKTGGFHELAQTISPTIVLPPKPTPQITTSLDQTVDTKVFLETVPKQLSSLVPENCVQNQSPFLEQNTVVPALSSVTKEVGVDSESGTCITNRNTRLQYNVLTLASSDRKTGGFHELAQTISSTTVLPPKPMPQITTSLDQTVNTKVFLETVPKQLSSLVPENCAQNQSPFLEQNTVVPALSSVTKEVGVDHESGTCIKNRNTRLQYNVLTLASSDRKTGRFHELPQTISPTTVLPPKPTPQITTSLDQMLDTKVFSEIVPTQIPSLLPEDRAQNHSPLLGNTDQNRSQTVIVSAATNDRKGRKEQVANSVDAITTSLTNESAALKQRFDFPAATTANFTKIESQNCDQRNSNISNAPTQTSPCVENVDSSSKPPLAKEVVTPRLRVLHPSELGSSWCPTPAPPPEPESASTFNDCSVPMTFPNGNGGDFCYERIPSALDHIFLALWSSRHLIELQTVASRLAVQRNRQEEIFRAQRDYESKFRILLGELNYLYKWLKSWPEVLHFTCNGLNERVPQGFRLFTSEELYNTIRTVEIHMQMRQQGESTSGRGVPSGDSSGYPRGCHRPPTKGMQHPDSAAAVDRSSEIKAPSKPPQLLTESQQRQFRQQQLQYMALVHPQQQPLNLAQQQYQNQKIASSHKNDGIPKAPTIDASSLASRRDSDRTSVSTVDRSSTVITRSTSEVSSSVKDFQPTQQQQKEESVVERPTRPDDEESEGFVGNRESCPISPKRDDDNVFELTIPNIMEVKTISNEQFDSIEEQDDVWNAEATSSNAAATLNEEELPALEEISQFETVNEQEMNVEVEEAKCLNCGRPSMVACGLCAKAPYCTKECQEKHWQVSHHATCNPILPSIESSLLLNNS